MCTNFQLDSCQWGLIRAHLIPRFFVPAPVIRKYSENGFSGAIGWLQVTMSSDEEDASQRSILDESKDLLAQLLSSHDEWTEVVGRAYLAVAAAHQLLDEPDLAFDQAKKALDVLLRSCGEDHEVVADARSVFADILDDLGQSEEAALEYEGALESILMNYGPDDQKTGEVRFELGRIFNDLGRFEEAQLQLEEALRVELSDPDSDRSAIAWTRHELGQSLEKVGKSELAREQLTLSLDLAQSEDQGQLDTRELLAEVLDSLELFAESHAERLVVLNMQTKLLGAAHREMAWTYYCLANASCVMEDYLTAKNEIEMALSIEVKEYGESHTEVAMTRTLYGEILQELEEYEKAREQLTKSLEIELKRGDDRAADVARVRFRLALVLLELEEFSQARDELSACIVTESEIFGELHPEVAISRRWLVVALGELGDIESELEQRRLVLKSLELNDVRDVVELIELNLELTSCLVDAVLEEGGTSENEAIECAETVLNLTREFYGQEHEEVGVAHARKGHVLFLFGRYQEALQESAKALKMAQVAAVDGMETENTIEARSQLAYCFDCLEKYELCREQREILLEWYLANGNKSDVAQAQEELAITLSFLDDYEKARSLMESALVFQVTHNDALSDDVGFLRFHLALTFWHLEEFASAYKQLGYYLQCEMANSGPESLNVAKAHYFLADTARRLEQLTEAREHVEISLRIREEELVSTDDDIYSTRDLYADILWQQGNHSEELKQRHILLETAFSHNDPDLAQVTEIRTKMGDSLLELGEIGDAKEQFERILKWQTEEFGRDHQKLEPTHRQLVETFERLGDFAHAKHHRERAMAIDLLRDHEED